MATTTIPVSERIFTADVVGPENGELVLLLHGFPQTRYTWRAELAALATAGFHACAFDQRGYSAGARPDAIDDYRVELLVDDVLGVASALGYRQFHLVGHDWGGHLAWVTAALHADRVRSLAIISRPHPAAFVRAMAADQSQSGRSGHHRAFQRAEATDELLTNKAAGLREIYARSGVKAADAAQYLSTLGQRPALDSAINWYRATARSAIKASDVPPVTMPTLYVWGNEDSTVGRAAALATADFVAGPYQFVEQAGIGHFVTDQAPDVFPPLLLEHLNQEALKRQ